MTKGKNISQITQLIKKTISEIDPQTDELDKKINTLLKMCDVAIKISKLEEDEEDFFANYKLNDVEISILEDFLKELREE